MPKNKTGGTRGTNQYQVRGYSAKSVTTNSKNYWILQNSLPFQTIVLVTRLSRFCNKVSNADINAACIILARRSSKIQLTFGKKAILEYLDSRFEQRWNIKPSLLREKKYLSDKQRSYSRASSLLLEQSNIAT